MNIKAKTRVAYYETNDHQYFYPIERALRQAVISITAKYKDTLSPSWAAQIRIADGDEVTDEEGDTFFEVTYSDKEHGEDAIEIAAGKLCTVSELDIETSGLNQFYSTYGLCEDILGKSNSDPETIEDKLIHEILQTQYCYDMTEKLHRKILKEYLYYFRDGGIKIRCDVTTNVDLAINTTAAPNAANKYHQTGRRFILIGFHGARVGQLDTFFALKIFKELQRILSEHETNNTFYYHIAQLETSNYLAKFFIKELDISETPA